MLRDATLSGFMEILRSNEIPFEFNKAESVLKMNETGSRILFRAVDEFERLRGTNLAWFGIDELTYTQQEVWTRLEARLRDPGAKRLCGFAVWTPKGFDWVYRRFISEPVDGYEAILAAPYENRFLLAAVPDFYERLARSYDGQFFQQEALGAYLSVNAGTVYHAFDRKRNVREMRVNPALPLLWAMDFNVDPMSSIVAQVAGDDINVLDEIVLRRATTQEACDEFCRRYPNHQAGVVVYGDASGARMQTAGTNDYAIVRGAMKANGYLQVKMRVPKSNPRVIERVALVNSLLWPADERVSLFVDPRCKGLVKDFEEVTFKPDSGVIDKERDPQRTHLSDALGYLVWEERKKDTTYGEQNRDLWRL